jgi:disulfide bond formation protein DsbB
MSAESIRLYNTFLALLALTALGIAVALVVYRVAKGGDAAMAHGRRALWLAWAVAAVATVGSLIYSEVIHFVPCRLCWFQRIFMYPLAIILLVGAIRRELVVKFYALPLSLIGLAISVWHYLIQVYPSLEGGSCDPVNPCSARYVEVFGFISIPFMAGAGFTLITVLLLIFVRPETE